MKYIVKLDDKDVIDLICEKFYITPEQVHLEVIIKNPGAINQEGHVEATFELDTFELEPTKF